MKIILPQVDQWSELNNQVKSWLGMGEQKNYTYLYQSVGHALKEVANHFERLMPHKKKIAYIKNCTPSIDKFVEELSGKGYQSISENLDVLSDPQTWIESFDADIALVIFPADHPITGEKYAWQKMSQLLLEKRIFSTRIYHSEHRKDELVHGVGRYESVLHSLSHSLSLVVGGARFRLSSLVAQDLFWDEKLIKEEICEAFDRDLENSQLVRKFEHQHEESYTAFFPQNMNLRLFDRALIYWNDIDSFAVMEILLERLSISLQEAQELSLVESLSPCRWKFYQRLSFFRRQGVSDEVCRGLLVINVELLKKPDFIPELLEAVKEVRRLSSFN